uniref:Uncharacterized protein n=1 Tax=Triticum urartu TaxID=4572 RepID=A0A8R7QU37_TRIUA
MCSTPPRPPQTVNRSFKRRIHRCPHGYIPIVFIKVAELLSLGMNLPPHSPVEGIANVTHLLSNHALPAFPFRLDIGGRQIDGIALGALLRLQIHKQLHVAVCIGEDVVVLLDEEDVPVEVPGLLQPIPHGVHHPPPVVLQRHDPRGAVVAILVWLAPAPLLGRPVLVPAVPGRDAGEGVREEVRRVGREDLLHLAEGDALDDLVHLGEVAVVADDEQRLADAVDAGEAVDDEAEVAGPVVDVEDDLEVAVGEGGEAARVARRQRVAAGEGEGHRALARQPRGEGRVEQDLALRGGAVAVAGGRGRGGDGGGRGQAAPAVAGAEERDEGEDREDDDGEERRGAGAEPRAVVEGHGRGGGAASPGSWAAAG